TYFPGTASRSFSLQLVTELIQLLARLDLATTRLLSEFFSTNKHFECEGRAGETESRFLPWPASRKSGNSIRFAEPLVVQNICWCRPAIRSSMRCHRIRRISRL